MKEKTNGISFQDIITLKPGMKFEPPEELISGVVHRGHLMQVLGPHSVGKSCLMMELTAAVTHGADWLGFKCREGNVLYINTDIDSNCWHKRYEEIRYVSDAVINGTNYKPNSVYIMSRAGQPQTLDKLFPQIIRNIHEFDYAAIIIDSLQRVFPGDEDDIFALNKVSTMLEQICDESGATVIYINNNPDIAYNLNSDTNLEIRPVAIENKHYVCSCEISTRHFPPIEPFKVHFEYPVHRREK